MFKPTDYIASFIGQGLFGTNLALNKPSANVEGFISILTTLSSENPGR
jgi:hypothetical protein